MEEMTCFGTESTNRITPAFGIDLGTTNSAISVKTEGAIPNIITLKNNKKTLPSCVTWLGGDKFIVGRESYERRWEPDTIYSVKRLMGSGKKVKLTRDGITREFEPEFISSLILRELCKEIEDEFGKVKDVVITVPAYFNDNEVSATKRAGELAGLNVIHILREPTAAALLYSSDPDSIKDGETTSLVYDLGGGTFDISLVKMSKKVCYPEIDELFGFPADESSDGSAGATLNVLANAGDMKLGGDDIDDEVLKIILEDLHREGLNISNLTRSSIERIKLKCEQTKKAFGEGTVSAEIWEKVEFKDGSEGKEVKINLTENILRRATEVIYNKTKKLVDDVTANIDLKRINSIVLVGGSTKSRYLKEFIAKDFPGMKIDCSLNPDEAVARGAAVQANIKKFGSSDFQVFDILPLAIGVLSDGLVSRIIAKNTRVPYSITKNFATAEPGQTGLTITVYQGNSALPEECVKLGDLEIDDIPVLDKSVRSSVGITLSVSAEGLLKCKASVNGVAKEVALKNLFSDSKDEKESTVVKTTLDSKVALRVAKWRKFAKTLSSEDSKELIKMLDSFTGDRNDERNIIKFISKHRNKLKD